MTPIFMRIWLMNITIVFERLMLPVSLRNACDIKRACRPICGSPISPSISALGVSAATESTTTTSTEPERTSMSAISSACSPLSGCEISKFLHVDAEFLRVLRIERVFGVDERRRAAHLLHLRDHRQRQRRFARGFGAVDFDHATARKSADAERDIEPERTRRYRLDVLGDIGLTQPHDGAFAELLFNLRQCCCECF